MIGLLALVLPITNGTPDAERDGVVALITAAGVPLCSGVVIGPHTVLTAGHCVAAVDTGQLFVFEGDAVGGPGTAQPVSDARVHPLYDPATFAHDLAVVTLRERASAPPLPLGTIDAAAVGELIEVVGFGVTAQGAGDAGVRRAGTARITGVTSLEITVAAAPSQPCDTDSGGVGFHPAGVVAGIVSHGDAACMTEGVLARVDVSVGDFIQPYLDQTAPGTAHTGDACLHAEQCAEGACLQAEDDAELWFCAQPCGVCPAGMECAAGQCRWPLPSPGAVGWPCADSSECAELCYEGACTRRCLTDERVCPAGYECVGTGGLDFYCLAAPPEGCCAVAAPARSGRARSALLIVLWLAAIVAARRR